MKKQQKGVDHVTGEKIPKSMVFARGKLSGSLKQLKMDLRKLMLPYTAVDLKVSSCIIFPFCCFQILILIRLANILLDCALCLCLQEKRRNNLRDFLNVAGPLGVTHFLIVSKTESSPYLKIARTPQGPTLTFKVHEYSLAVDIARSQLRPRCPKDLFKNSPLVIIRKRAYMRGIFKHQSCAFCVLLDILMVVF